MGASFAARRRHHGREQTHPTIDARVDRSARRTWASSGQSRARRWRGIGWRLSWGGTPSDKGNNGAWMRTGRPPCAIGGTPNRRNPISLEWPGFDDFRMLNNRGRSVDPSRMTATCRQTMGGGMLASICAAKETGPRGGFGLVAPPFTPLYILLSWMFNIICSVSQ